MRRNAWRRPVVRAVWKGVVCLALLGGCGRVTRDAPLSSEPRADGGSVEVTEPTPKKGALGGGCEPLSELDPEFGGFNVEEVTIDTGTPARVSGTCVVQGFQGRVSCPYGQIDTGYCSIPGSDEPVVVAVPAQLVNRPPEVSAVCSCQCAGPGPGPYCACPHHLECTHLVDDLGFATVASLAYCLPRGARYERGSVHLLDECDRELMNCEP